MLFNNTEKLIKHTMLEIHLSCTRGKGDNSSTIKFFRNVVEYEQIALQTHVKCVHQYTL